MKKGEDGMEELRRFWNRTAAREIFRGGAWFGWFGKWEDVENIWFSSKGFKSQKL